ncbi:MAG TPA: histidine kinase [Cyanobacteria bacterium UBA8803]|nr:histidine kinase [Cyanobacteria bacterium UBA9273]HBL61539.1 histidine kinase [Cyanobacteria bacterium UBA8803]
MRCVTSATKAPMVNHLTLGLAHTVELAVTQEHQASLMHYPAESTEIGQQITQIILTNPEPQTLLSAIARALGEMLQVDSCLIGAMENSVISSHMALWCSSDKYTLAPKRHQAQLWQHPLLRVNSSGEEILAIRDIQESDYGFAIEGYPQLLPARALLLIHTRFQASVNGVIILGRQEPHEWTHQEKQLLSSSAQSVAIAISHVQLTHQARAAERYQALLNQLSLAMRSHLNLDEILQVAIAVTAEVLQVDRSLLLLLKEGDPPLENRGFKQQLPDRVTVAAEWWEETYGEFTNGAAKSSRLLNQSFLLSESYWCQEALKNAPTPLAIADWQDTLDIDLENQSVSIFEQEMMSALLMVPLLGLKSHRSEPAPLLGFLVLQHNQPRPWLNDELEMVKWVSTQLSATIIQNQTLEQVQSLVAERTAQLQHSLDVQAKLYEKTRRQVEQLQEFNQLKEDFISTMNHELRTPLTAMSLAIRMLRQPKLSAKRRDKYLEILEEQCNQEIELINDLLSLQQLESNPSQLQRQTFDLMLLIHKLAESFEEKWVNKRLTLKVDAPASSLSLDTDPDSLNRILLELLTNAGKYSDLGTTVDLQISVQVQPSGNYVVLTLTNTGLGISPTDLKHIFEKFRRGQGITQQAVPGTGLGLALVKCLVEHLNGTIEVSSNPLANSQSSVTAFTVTLPQK